MRLPAPLAAVGRLHLTPRAAALVAAVIPIVALVRGTWSTALAAGWLVLASAAVAYDASRAVHVRSLEWTRDLPPKLSIGVPNRVALTVTNRGPREARLVARETPPSGFEGERAIGPLSVPAGEEHSIVLHFTPPARGLFRFGAVGFRSVGPWGLAGWQGAAGLEQDASVYPDIQAVRSFAMLARRDALAEIGVRRIRLRGEGTEFESLRDYQQDDDYRDIDWKATARRGKPIVRSFEAERSQTMVLAVDTGRLMTPRAGTLAKLDRAVNAALLLAYLGVERDDHVGLLVFGRDVETFLAPKKGHKQFLAILDALHSVEGRLEEPDYDRAMRHLTARLSRRSLVVMFTDIAGTDPSRRLLGALTGLTPRHLPLLITQRNRDIEARSRMPLDAESDVFSAAVAETLLADKATALRTLAARGTLVLDVFPEQLSVAAVNRYLQIKARGRL